MYLFIVGIRWQSAKLVTLQGVSITLLKLLRASGPPAAAGTTVLTTWAQQSWLLGFPGECVIVKSPRSDYWENRILRLQSAA